MRSLRFACRSWSSLLFGAVVALFGPVASTVGQCGQQWLPGHGMPGVDVYPYSATWWQPTVGGLQNPQLVVGGIFDHAGTVQATNIAAFDWVTRTWSALGAGLPGIVGRVGVLPNGRLIARNCGTNPLLPTIGVYEWDGTNWLPLGGGVNGAVGDFVVMNNGDLIVVGQFTIAGSVPAHNVARWDGTSWHALAQGTPGFTGCITKLPNGDIAVAECYSTSLLPWNPAWYVRIHRWDGANWTTLAQPSMPVRTLTALPNGDLVAGGSFMDIGNCIARWDGTAWMDMSGGIGGTQPIVEGLLGLGNGDLIATGRFSYIGGAQVANVARWNGSSWLPMGNGLNGVGISAFELPTGEVALVGNFTEAGDVEATGVALWNGVDWRATGNELDGSVRALAVATNGDLLAGGAFTS
jgi:hypothetical protein